MRRTFDEECKQDRGAFFRSIHGTLNHLLLADKIWLGRFERVPFPAVSLDQQLFSRP
ncbi:DinB family protein [Nitrosomonas sp.]|uniref:DinB family protein n=1 Tax=Nitrosomonas sp. TaxID=42353 RepID=UPI0033055D56